MTRHLQLFIAVFVLGCLGIVMTSCGGGGSGTVGGGGGGGGTSGITLEATGLKNKQAVASLSKPYALDWMWAFLSGNDANAAHETCDANKRFNLSGGGSVCLDTAYIVFDEIELEQEDDTTGTEDEVEAGPFVVDLLGVTNDGIPGDIDLTVPDGVFDEIKFKVDDLDDDDDDGLKTDDDGNSDDVPENVSIASIPAGLVKRSLIITGSATGVAGEHTAFTFTTDIEARIKIPFSDTVLDGGTIITFFDLTTAFGNRNFSEISATMTALFSSSKCSDAGLDAAHKLACDIVKNIDLFEDVDNDDVGDDSEDRGDDRGTGGADDTQPHD
ncbi:MAG: hypothetical protein AAB244_00945 [Nitrospirota bacterium]